MAFVHLIFSHLFFFPFSSFFRLNSILFCQHILLVLSGFQCCFNLTRFLSYKYYIGDSLKLLRCDQIFCWIFFCVIYTQLRCKSILFSCKCVSNDVLLQCLIFKLFLRCKCPKLVHKALPRSMPLLSFWNISIWFKLCFFLCYVLNINSAMKKLFKKKLLYKNRRLTQQNQMLSTCLFIGTEHWIVYFQRL